MHVAELYDAHGTFDWPGNVRELEKIIERGVALSSGGRVPSLADTSISMLPGLRLPAIPRHRCRRHDPRAVGRWSNEIRGALQPG